MLYDVAKNVMNNVGKMMTKKHNSIFWVRPGSNLYLAPSSCVSSFKKIK